MREVLFRGKRKDNGEWVYGQYCELRDGKTTIPCIYYKGEIIKETLGQYTGLTDKNGKKIFEGDIVQYYGTYPLEVYIEKGHTKIRWYDTISTLNCNELFYGTDNFYGECEIIGNIHDNPELLKGAENNG